jgi:drug/metabolite transporter (DMT)-like permease
MGNAENNAAKGIAYMVATTLIFAVQDGLSKYLAAEYSPIFITMVRYWVFALVVIALLSRHGFRSGLKSGQPILQISRGVLLAVEICVAVLAFHLLGLSTTHAVFAFTPLLIVALSGPFLGERIGWRRWMAVGFGLIGMVMIIRPGAVEISPSILIAVLAMIMFAAYGLATRRVARTDSAMTSFYYTGLAGAAAMTLVGPFFWEPMTAEHSLIMLVLCCTGMTGHYFLIKAFEAAEAASIQPFAYLQTIFATIVGIVWFSEEMSMWTGAGAALVIGAGLFAFWRERVRAAKVG